jgi:hypothetical protein
MNLTKRGITMNSASNYLASVITMSVSQNTTVEHSLLSGNNDYRDVIENLIKSGTPMKECITEMTHWVNNNY